jgi:hypothetical protein
MSSASVDNGALLKTIETQPPLQELSIGPETTTKSLRKNSEIDALVVEADVLARIRRWILGVAVVDFDVDDGPVITGIYPPLAISPAEAENMYGRRPFVLRVS